ncbi:transposase [Streptomyces sp. CA-135486]|uniref:transposase n=1 Tax=Streptomyces sp. CA-135486 TaxID=3240049 RepID=UPI003D8DCA71
MGVCPAAAARGVAGPKRLDGRILNRIVWKFRTGTAWRNMPQRYGSWATLHTRFRRSQLRGDPGRAHRRETLLLRH